MKSASCRATAPTQHRRRGHPPHQDGRRSAQSRDLIQILGDLKGTTQRGGPGAAQPRPAQTPDTGPCVRSTRGAQRWHRQLGAESEAFPVGLTALTENGARKIYSFNASGNYISAGGMWGLDLFHTHQAREGSSPTFDKSQNRINK